MKTLIAIAIALASLTTQGATNLVSLSYLSGTNNGNVYWASNIVIPRQRYIFQSLGITNGGFSGSYTTNGITNLLAVNLQLSIDASNTNWLTLATWKPSNTNAEVASEFYDFIVSLPIRAQVITTNPIGVATFKQ